MSLPNPSMSFTPFDILTAEEMNNIVENVEALATGTGLDTGAVTTAKILDASVTTAKIADDGVTAAKIDWASTGANGGIWWEELGRQTLGVAGDTISVNISSRKFIRLLFFIKSSGITFPNLRFNNDTSANYAFQYHTVNNTSNSSGNNVSSTVIGLAAANMGSGDIGFGTYDVYSPSGLGNTLVNGTFQLTGTLASNFDPTQNNYGHWVNASQVSSVQIVNTNTGDFDIGSELIVLGHN